MTPPSPRSCAVALLTLTALGCAGSDTEDTAGADTDATCAVRLVSTTPEDGATDAYARGTIELELTDADPFATLTVDGVSGVTTTRGSRGQIVVFTPDAPLAPLTAYTATVSWCGGTEPLSFQTSEAGAPLEDPTALAGRVFAVPFRDGRIVEPAGAAGVLGQYILQTDLLSIDTATADTLAVTNGLAVDLSDPAVQDWCVPTVPFESADFSDAPHFRLAADRVQMPLAGLLVTLQQLEVTGTFLPDGRSLVGGDVRYVMDMRALAPMVDATDPNSVCAAAAQFDTTCSACPDSGEPYCLAFHLDHLEGTLVEDLVLDPVSGVNCEACEAAPPPADAVCE